MRQFLSLQFVKTLLKSLSAIILLGLLGACQMVAPPVPDEIGSDSGTVLKAEGLRGTLEAVVNGGGNLGRFAALNRYVDSLGLAGLSRSEGIDWFSLQRNLIIEIPGRSAETIYLIAHYDKTDANPFSFVSLLINGFLDPIISPTYLSDGAIDNASGVAVVLQLADELSSGEHYYSYRFLFPGAEESGLRGSRAHIARLSDDERERIKYVINVDSVGVTGAGNCVTAGVSDPHLSYLAQAVAKKRAIPLAQESSSNTAVSDYLPFMETDFYADVSYGLKFNHVGGLLPQRSWFTGEMSVPVLNFSACGLMGGAADILSSFLLPIGKLHGFRDEISKIDIMTLYNQYALLEGLLAELEHQSE
ncbi:MAG: M28 family peptidase [Desulfuromonadales bacterium]|nr:M28 family peptidase [Desulfuromonadales bacterium]